MAFYQQLIFPDSGKDSDTVSITVNNKCYNLDELVLKLYCLDYAGNVIHADSIDINNDSCWVQKTTIFSLSGAKKIIVGFYGWGKLYAYKKQKLWLDRVDILINGKNIESFDRMPVVNRVELDANAIVLLNINDKNSFRGINIPDNKRIIGLGESMHGSRTISQIDFQTLKYLITSKRCRLILLESTLYESLLWDLYAQGKMDDEFLTEIKESVYFSLFPANDLCNFLIWLREYNSSLDRKVKIRGLMDYDYTHSNELFDYLYAFFDKNINTSIYPVLNLMQNLRMGESLDSLKRLPIVKEKMGDEDYKTFLHAMNRANNANKPLTSKGRFHKMMGRDYTMAQNAIREISAYLQENETAAIIAHDAHINRKGSSMLFPYIYSLGYYLNQKYGDAYYPIGIYAGKGCIRTSLFDNSEFLVKYDLKTPISGSLEEICYSMHDSCFFYPATYLPDVRIYYRQIGNSLGGNESQSYGYEFLKDRIDGFIFVKESENIQIPSKDYFDIILEKIKKHNEIIKMMEKTIGKSLKQTE